MKINENMTGFEGQVRCGRPISQNWTANEVIAAPGPCSAVKIHIKAGFSGFVKDSQGGDVNLS